MKVNNLLEGLFDGGPIEESEELVQTPSAGKITPSQLRKKISELARTVADMAADESPEGLKHLASKSAALHEHIVALTNYYKSTH